MLHISEKFKNHDINCKAINIGNDWNITIYGGDIPHIGAVAVGIPIDLPHNINKLTSSSSLITVPGHKEDEIVNKSAKLLAKQLNTTVVVSCGIHIKNITFDEINILNNIIYNLINKLSINIKNYKV